MSERGSSKTSLISSLASGMFNYMGMKYRNRVIARKHADLDDVADDVPDDPLLFSSSSESSDGDPDDFIVEERRRQYPR